MVAEAHERSPLSDEHFIVDGTLIEAAASLKNFRRRDGDPPTMSDQDPGNPSVDFHGERRVNATHRSTTDPEARPSHGRARLFRKGKGKEAKLVFLAHALMENRNGLLADFQVTQATGRAERDAVSFRGRAVPVLLDQARERRFHPKTVGRDKGYDTRDCVAAMRERRVTPHVAQNTIRRSSAIDGGGRLGIRGMPGASGCASGQRRSCWRSCRRPQRSRPRDLPRVHCAWQAPKEGPGAVAHSPTPVQGTLDPSSGRATALNNRLTLSHPTIEPILPQPARASGPIG